MINNWSVFHTVWKGSSSSQLFTHAAMKSSCVSSRVLFCFKKLKVKFRICWSRCTFAGCLKEAIIYY